MGQFLLTKSTYSPHWRNIDPDLALGANLYSVESMSDIYAKRIVARAKRRMEILPYAHEKKTPPPIINEDQYIATACADKLRGACFVAADEMTCALVARGAKAKCVQIKPKASGGDHFFTVVNCGTKKTSVIVDATWQQFALGAQPFCLVGTIEKLKPAIKQSKASFDLVDAYETGLGVLDQWATYSCFV